MYKILRVLKTEKQLLFEVEDTGIGIKEENLKKLFKLNNPSQRDDSDSSFNIQGAGLGLVTSQEILKKMNGHRNIIKVSSI